jgi:hypothetical protein
VVTFFVSRLLTDLSACNGSQRTKQVYEISKVDKPGGIHPPEVGLTEKFGQGGYFFLAFLLSCVDFQQSSLHRNEISLLARTSLVSR